MAVKTLLTNVWNRVVKKPDTFAFEGTLVDMRTVTRICTLVSMLAFESSDVDSIALRLESLLRRFPPSEPIMARLSIMHQELQGSGGREEFCVALAFSVSMMCCVHRPRLSRTVSCPALYSKLVE